MTLTALGLLPISFFAAKSVTAIQMVLTFVLVMAGHVSFLPALLLLQVTPTDFQGGTLADYDTQLERFETLNFYIAGIPLSPNYVLLGTIALRVLFELVTSPSTFRGIMHPVIFIAWCICLALDMTTSLYTRFEGVASWTVPFRTQLVLAAYWYGAILFRDRTLIYAILNRRFFWLAAALVGITRVSFFLNRSLWFCMAILPPLLAARIKTRAPLQIIIAVIALAIDVAAAAGIYASAALAATIAETMIGVGSTLTTMGIFATSMACTGLWIVQSGRQAPTSYRQQRRLARLVFVGSALLLTVTPLVVPPLTMGTSVGVRRYGEHLTLVERLSHKLFDERGAIWRGAIEEILDPPYVIKPVPEATKIIFPDGSTAPWKYGAHNLLLDLLTKNRWVTGLFAYVFFLVSLWHVSLQAVAGREPGIRTLAVAALATGVMTSLSGSAVLDAVGGFLYLSSAGLAAMQNRLERRTRLTVDGGRAMTQSPRTLPDDGRLP